MKLSYASLVILFHRNNAFSSTTSILNTNTRCAQKSIINCHQLSLLQTVPPTATNSHTITAGSISSRIETKLYSEPDSGVGGKLLLNTSCLKKVCL